MPFYQDHTSSYDLCFAMIVCVSICQDVRRNGIEHLAHSNDPYLHLAKFVFLLSVHILPLLTYF